MSLNRRLRTATSGAPPRSSGGASPAYALPGRDVFDVVPVPIWMIGVQGTLWYGNRAWHRLTAAERFSERQTGVGWLEAVHQDDRHKTLAALRAAAARRRRSLEVELRVGSTDTWRSWSLTGAPYSETSGEGLMFVGTAQETTAAREADVRLRDLGARLVTAQEVERARIARELHDDLAQRVALLAAKLGLAGDRRPFTAKHVREDLAAARRMLRELSVSIHTLSHELHPSKLRLLGLSPTLRSLCEEVSGGCGTPIHFTADDDSIDVADATALCVYRVTQEALQNAVKHSGAGRVEVALSITPSQITLRIADNGCGFDPAACGDAGIGLLTMRERVELVRGWLQIVSERGSGTLVEAVLPFAPRTSGLTAPAHTRD